MDTHAPLLTPQGNPAENEEAGSKRRGGALVPDGGRGGPEVVPGRAEAAGRQRFDQEDEQRGSGKFQPQLFIKELNT